MSIYILYRVSSQNKVSNALNVPSTDQKDTSLVYNKNSQFACPAHANCFGTSSEWSRYVKPRSYFFMPLTTQAAAFMTRWVVYPELKWYHPPHIRPPRPSLAYQALQKWGIGIFRPFLIIFEFFLGIGTGKKQESPWDGPSPACPEQTIRSEPYTPNSEEDTSCLGPAEPYAPPTRISELIMQPHRQNKRAAGTANHPRWPGLPF